MEEKKKIEKIRIQKYLSDSGHLSRRAAEAAIIRGEIKVNGLTAEIGMKVGEEDKITYKGTAVEKRMSGGYEYIVLNKPVGYVTTMNDEKGRPCVKELVEEFGKRIYPAGRLDMDSEGLLIFTNDGELSNLITHPKSEIPKTYHVVVNSLVSPEQKIALSQPMEIDNYIIKAVKNEILEIKGGMTLIKFELYEGRNRQIRKMCQKAGLSVKSLKRVAVGQVFLGNLKPGMWRKLTFEEIKYLKTACGIKI